MRKIAGWEQALRMSGFVKTGAVRGFEIHLAEPVLAAVAGSFRANTKGLLPAFSFVP